ncbi:MAG: YczE/YyaS/YitT family protein [Ilumatobacteraceae bacterium]
MPGDASPLSMRPLRERFAERLARCVAGLTMFGIGIAFFVRGDIGVPPWDVFHQGVSENSGYAIGTVIVFTGFAVLLLWVPFRLRPGIGTVLNAVQIGIVENIAEPLIPESPNPGVGVLYVALGMLAIAAGSGLYIGAELGSGPRDGLMIGVNARFGISVRAARTTVEVVVLVVGVALGGGIGVGTFVFAFGIGPLVQIMLARFRMSPSLVAAAESEAAEQ